MKNTSPHHIGFSDDTPAEVNFSDESFVRPVEPSEKCNMRHCVIGFMGAWGVFTLLLLGFLYIALLKETFITGLIFALLWLLWFALGIFHGHILKFFLIHKVKSRPNRLFKPDWKCVLVAIEDSNTFYKLKFIPEDFGLIYFGEGFVEIEMTNYRARFATRDITISEHVTRTWLKRSHGVKITYGLSPWTWNVTVTSLFQGCNFFSLLTEALMAKWLLKKFQKPFEIKPDSQKMARRIIKTIAFLGIIHFCMSLGIWGLFAYAEASGDMEIDWPMFLHAIPATVLFLCFILAFAKANQKIRQAEIIFGLAIVGCVSCFFFDTVNHFYQFSTPYGGYYYVNWWWHNFPFKEPEWKQFKYGYIDKSGKKVIEPKFDYAAYFSDGLAYVRVGNLNGYINNAGEYVVEPKFEYVGRFSEGLASVNVNGKYGYIDTTGRIVIEPKFDYAYDFSEGLARAGVDNNDGYIDKTGQMIIKSQYRYSGEFSQGLAIAEVDYKYGYIDTTGKMVIEPNFSYARDFSEDFAAVEFDEKWGFIDKTGQIVIEPKFDGAGSFSEGLASVRVNDKYGYIDKSGKFVIEPQYERATHFRDGKAIVYYGNNGKLGYRRVHYTDCIDRTGKPLFKTNFERISPFHEGFAFFVSDNSLWGYIDEDGKVVIEPKFFWCSIFSEGLAPVQVKVDR